MPALVLAAATALLVFVLAACATRETGPAAAPTLYQRLGGQDAITAVVDDAVDRIAADPRINRRFSGTGIPHLKARLVELLCLRSGGPCVYTGRDMASAHEGMNIRDDEFDALAQDVARSLDKFQVPAPEKDELMRILGQMRNAVVGH
jgi:hemoglobin